MSTSLIGRRVAVTTRDGSVTHGILSGLPPAGGVMVRCHEQRTELSFSPAEMSSWKVDQHTCTQCLASSDTIFSGICAGCTRSNAALRGRGEPICEGCGEKRATFRNPSDKTSRFLCVTCHAAQGTLPPETKLQDAACVAAPADDGRHRWQLIRGTRYGCTECYARVYRKLS